MAFSIIFLLFLLPTQSLMDYTKYNLDQLCPRTNGYVDKILHNAEASTINIYDNPSMSSVLLEHVWDNSSYKHMHHCEFNVQTRSKWTSGATRGLFVAVRELKFRQNEHGECIDYVVFELNLMGMPSSHKVCGTTTEDEGMQAIKNYFEIPDGVLKIIVHIGHHNLEPNEIAMKLTFTAFEDCNENGAYKFRCSNNKCISMYLYDDSIINCMPPFCADEPRFYTKCGTKPTYFTSHTHVLAVGSCLGLLIFGVTLAWYFLKMYVTCSRYFGNSDRLALNQSVEYRTVYVPPTTNSRNGGEFQSNTDAPPSYESLYY